MTVRNKPQDGFTLVELAIVLVIIGLIVGGVLVGQDLIKAASIRATVTQVEKFNAAATTFRGKYQGYPGDITNNKAVEFGFNSVGATDAARDGTAGKGDGNGLVEGCAAGGINLGCETLLFWVDLGKAGLVPNTTSLTSVTAVAQAGAGNATLQPLLPTSKVRESALFTVFPLEARNWYGVGTLSTGAAGLLATAPGLSPLEARGIDEKLDDGLPLTGTVKAVVTNLTTPAVAAAAGPCVGTVAGNPYIGINDSLLNAIGCSIVVRASF